MKGDGQDSIVEMIGARWSRGPLEWPPLGSLQARFEALLSRTNHRATKIAEPILQHMHFYLAILRSFNKIEVVVVAR